jgi:predicted Zn-dependent peptidase
MAGDFDPDKTIAIIEKYFGQWKPGADVSQPVFPVQRPLTAPVDTTVVGQQTEQVWMGWLAPKASELACDTLDVIGGMLCNGKAGLFDLNLNQQMRVQTADAGLQAQQDYSSFLVIGQPKPGQSLEEVRSLMLAEIDNLKKGNFSDDLLPSIVNNMKLSYQHAVDNNRWRVTQHMNSFINGDSWEQHAGKMQRVAGMTKQQIVDFANRFFTNGYATVFKKQGVDSLQKKIDKPAITPIPTNRDLVSRFVQDIQQSEVEPIQPVFVDFSKDMTKDEAKKGLPLLYKQNTDNDLFTLTFRYEFGHEDDNRYAVASDYLDYVGTDKLTAADIKQKFYKLACNYSVNVDADVLTVTLSGLNENMPEALKLMENVLHNAKADKQSYEQFVDLTLKEREDAKSDQRTCFDYLYYYSVYGPHNMRRDDMTAQQLRDANPQQLLNLLGNLSNLQHTVLYYGPMTAKQLTAVLNKQHTTAKQLKAVPVGQPFTPQQTPVNEVWIAPYDAKNIYMRMFHNENRPFSVDDAAIVTTFNEYFGGGMNAIVFQELREARGLAYNAYAVYNRGAKKDDKQSFFTHIITQNDKMMDCVRQFHQILDTIPQSESAFQIAKDAILKQLASHRTTKMNVINLYLSMQRLGLNYDLNEKVYREMEKITLQDVVRFEQQQIARKPYRYIILGDEKELDMPSLEKIGPIRRLSIEDIFTK